MLAALQDTAPQVIASERSNHPTTQFTCMDAIAEVGGLVPQAAEGLAPRAAGGPTPVTGEARLVGMHNPRPW